MSLGTILIRNLAELAPQRVASMVMGGAVTRLGFRTQTLVKLGDACKHFIPYMWLYRLFAHVLMPTKAQDESRNMFIREAKKLCQKEFKRWFTLIAEVNPLLKYFRFNDSGKPTLYIMGSEDHMFLPSITKLAEDHKMSELFVVPNCGHVVNVEQPELFNETAIAFLKREKLALIRA